MEILTPSFGLLFWTAIAFLIVFFLLAKFAWKPILKSIRDRENFIEESLKNANIAEEKFKNINLEIQALLKQAQSEKVKLIKEGNELRVQRIEEAQKDAREEANKIIAIAKEKIEKEKMIALQDIKKQTIKLVVLATEKILSEKLKTTKEQEKIIEKCIKSIEA